MDEQSWTQWPMARPAIHSFIDPQQLRAYIADNNTPQA